MVPGGLPGASASVQQLATSVSRQKFPYRHASVHMQGARHLTPTPPKQAPEMTTQMMS